MSAKYRLYPSLMDKFQKYLDSDQEFESFWNVTPEGEYKKTLDEITEANRQAVLDAINRVSQEPSEAADKGTCFNEVVDCIVHNRKPERKDIRIEVLGTDDNRYIAAHKYDEQAVEDPAFSYETAEPRFTFLYDIAMCREVAAKYHGALSQQYTEAEIETSYGTVLLYGYIDEWMKDRVIDIKTSKSYEFGQFDDRWQRFVYPYCLTEQGYEVNMFEFHMLKWKGGTDTNPILSGDFYVESYNYKHDAARMRLRAFIERFVEFIELNRGEITDSRIFNNVQDK